MESLAEQPVLQHAEVRVQVRGVRLERRGGHLRLAVLNRLRGDSHLLPGDFVGERTVGVQTRGRDEVKDWPQERLKVGLFILAVLCEQPPELRGLAVKTRSPVRGHVMAHDRAVSPALGDDGLGRVVRGVHVHVGHGPEQLVAPAQGVVPEGRAGEPLDRTVHAHVKHGIRAEAVFLLEPLVVRGVLRMRGEVTLEEQTHGITLDAESGLDADEHVADLQPGDERPFPGNSRESVVGIERAPRILHVAHQHV